MKSTHRNDDPSNYHTPCLSSPPLGLGFDRSTAIMDPLHFGRMGESNGEIKIGTNVGPGGGGVGQRTDTGIPDGKER